nr:ribulose-1,5-bisphosphate carboxylase/oxygenase large subunit, chloroplastic [Tanacetum cinerariifolium]
MRYACYKFSLLFDHISESIYSMAGSDDETPPPPPQTLTQQALTLCNVFCFKALRALRLEDLRIPTAYVKTFQ